MLPKSRVTEYLKVLLLALTVATVTLLNQRQVAVWQQVPVAQSSAAPVQELSNETSPHKAVVYQKVCFEATPGFAVPMPLAAVLPEFTWVQLVPALVTFTLPNLPKKGFSLALAGLFGSVILTRAP